MSASKPLIGMNMGMLRGVSYIPTNYADSIAQYGGVPVLLPPTNNEGDIERTLSLLDGIVFIGGRDLDPRNDGYLPHPSQKLLDPAREVFDRKLMWYAASIDMPTLGIGCGMQLLNLSQGGTLSFHIPEDFPNAIPHWDDTDVNHGHILCVQDGDSIMSQVYGKIDCPRVTSQHHMAVDDVAEGFRVTAKSPDGIVEAIESTTSWLAVGVQFHPEAGNLLDKLIFEVFITRIQKLKKTRKAA